ncbi:hypothetical protein Bca101_075503 [Brassica carinata]
MDLINEIFSRLPAKSVARFSCLSKQWRDMLDRSYFKELFFTRSSVWPRLLFSVKRDGYDDLCLFSSPQPRDLYEKSSSLVVTADFHMKDVEDPNSEWSEHVYTFRKTNQCVGCSHVSTLWKNQIVAGVLSVVGVTATGDIVLCMEDVSKPLYVFYLNIERKTLQRVEFRTANNEAFEKCSSKEKTQIPISQLIFDLIMEILSRLPGK